MNSVIEAFQPKGLTDGALQEYDAMMVEVSMKIADVAPLATWVWSSVLKELAERGKITLKSGSLDYPGGTIIIRHYMGD